MTFEPIATTRYSVYIPELMHKLLSTTQHIQDYTPILRTVLLFEHLGEILTTPTVHWLKRWDCKELRTQALFSCSHCPLQPCSR